VAGKRRTVDEELETLHALRSAPISPEIIEALRAALRSPRSLVAERAAIIARERNVQTLERELIAAFERFLDDPVKRDPGCRAKLAAVEALDFLDHLDPAPFVVAARHVQMEPAWGPPVDTAVALRGRGLVALGRLGHADLALIAGELLADRESPVRQAAADALALLGDRGAASSLALKLVSGDEDPLVLTACAAALLALAPDWALPRFRSYLLGKKAILRETVALALGQSRLDDAHGLLIELLESVPTADERSVALRALGLHRSERSLVVLLETIATGTRADARAAVQALAARRFEPGLPARVGAAVEENGATELEAVFREAFADSG
jgi:HEAT repeat protein